MTAFNQDVLKLDLEAKAEELSEKLQTAVLKTLKRRGLVVAVSGGIDSACVLALAVKALGPRRVFGLLLPERDSSGESAAYGRKLCEKMGVAFQRVDIAPMLEASGCYRMRDDAVASVDKGFQPGMPWKIVSNGNRLDSDAVNVFSVVVQRPNGETVKTRLTPRAYLEIVAATNFKQRTRKMMEYFHADRLIYACSGTPNRLEYDQGFFVKLGDGAADVKPIAGLYKTQVYAMARHLGVIDEILDREPTTDTFSLAQSQEDFYFSLHYRSLDMVLWAMNHGVSADACGEVLGFSGTQVQRVYDDLEQKRRTTAYLHAPPVLLDEVVELQPYAL
ncbi:MAG: NAD(+) synthase [Archangium sp.]|nr:NAD(+) synthase [Archangium sp.]